MLGEKLRRLRRSHKLTLRRLAELSEMPSSGANYIWKLEHDRNPNPSAEKLAKIAKQLDVTVEYLLDDRGTISHEDACFFHDYLSMDSRTKTKVRQLVDLWSDQHEPNASPRRLTPTE